MGVTLVDAAPATPPHWIVCSVLSYSFAVAAPELRCCSETRCSRVLGVVAAASDDMLGLIEFIMLLFSLAFALSVAIPSRVASSGPLPTRVRSSVLVMLWGARDGLACRRRGAMLCKGRFWCCFYILFLKLLRK